MKTQLNEVWKDIKGYEGIYQISNYGRVKSLGRTIITAHYRQWHEERILAICNVDRNGYQGYCLRKNGQNKIMTAHRLVAEHFLDNPLNKPEVNHLDEDKANNHIDNLAWVTSSENHQWSTKAARSQRCQAAV